MADEESADDVTSATGPDPSAAYLLLILNQRPKYFALRAAAPVVLPLLRYCQGVWLQTVIINVYR